MNLQELRRQTVACAEEIARLAGLRENSVLVAGCSTSAVQGEAIGTSGSSEIASVIYSALSEVAGLHGLKLVFQCCEHLNRALVLEKQLADELRCDIVSVVPKPNAGGALASHAWQMMNQPVAVEFFKGDAGMDIGGVLIGMHVRHVAVPLKLTNCVVGNAKVTAAGSRPKLIGGERAQYK